MIEKISAVKENIINGFNSLSNSPVLCAFLFCVFFFVFYLFIGVLINKLFRVHRSKTACRKIMKEYSFWQKALLFHHKTHCLHAKSFCEKMVNYLYVHAVFFAFGIIAMIIEGILTEKASVSAYILIIQAIAFTLPSFIIDIILAEFPLRKMSPYKFEKYHQTKEYDKLT